MALGGHYKTGTVTATNGSPTVTLTGGSWVDVLEGDSIILDGLNYPIASDVASPSYNTITLELNYGGTTGSGKSYVVRKDSWKRYDVSDTYRKAQDLILSYQNIANVVNVSGVNKEIYLHKASAGDSGRIKWLTNGVDKWEMGAIADDWFRIRRWTGSAWVGDFYIRDDGNGIFLGQKLFLNGATYHDAGTELRIGNAAVQSNNSGVLVSRTITNPLSAHGVSVNDAITMVSGIGAAAFDCRRVFTGTPGNVGGEHVYGFQCVDWFYTNNTVALPVYVGFYFEPYFQDGRINEIRGMHIGDGSLQGSPGFISVTNQYGVSIEELTRGIYNRSILVKNTTAGANSGKSEFRGRVLFTQVADITALPSASAGSDADNTVGGSAQFLGGVGIAKSLWLGGNFTIMKSTPITVTLKSPGGTTIYTASHIGTNMEYLNTQNGYFRFNTNVSGIDVLIRSDIDSTSKISSLGSPMIGAGLLGLDGFNGDLILVPRTSAAGRIQMWTGNGTAVKRWSMDELGKVIHTAPASTGYVGIFKNSTGATGNNGLKVAVGPNGADSSSLMIHFTDAGEAVTIGSINRNGTNTTAFTGSSDERRKHKFDEGETDWGKVIDSVWVGGFAWKEDDTSTVFLGVRAQQAQEHFPQGIVHNEVADYWGADYSQFGALALWGVKELRTRIVQLQNEIAELRRK